MLPGALQTLVTVVFFMLWGFAWAEPWVFEWLLAAALDFELLR